jgi:hypothetical protein
MTKTIPLSRLIPSPRNVRRSSDEQADLQLKADIEARGSSRISWLRLPESRGARSPSRPADSGSAR